MAVYNKRQDRTAGPDDSPTARSGRLGARIESDATNDQNHSTNVAGQEGESAKSLASRASDRIHDRYRGAGGDANRPEPTERGARDKLVILPAVRDVEQVTETPEDQRPGAIEKPPRTALAVYHQAKVDRLAKESVRQTQEESPKATNDRRSDGPVYSVTTVVRPGDRLYPGPQTPFARTAEEKLTPNTIYDIKDRERSNLDDFKDRGRFYTDDSGKVIRGEFASYGRRGDLNYDLNRPQPDMAYVVRPKVIDPIKGVDYRHEFRTDDQGRTVELRINRLAFGDAERAPSVQAKVGKEGGRDHEGAHFAANWWGGGPERLNLSSIHKDLNRGAGESFGNQEREWARLMRGSESRPPVAIEDVRFEVDYKGSTRVPAAFIVRWIEDGVRREKEFVNRESPK